MFRIRQVANPYLEVNLSAVNQVKSLIAHHFSSLQKEKIDQLLEQLIDPLKYRFHAILFVAEDLRDVVKGFAFMFHFPDAAFCYLDYLAVLPGRIASGIGGALYERSREEALALNAEGLYFECLPDDPALCGDQAQLEQNKKRLAFYERYGARPIVGTAYETPVNPGDDSPPYLLFDDLGRRSAIRADRLKSIMRIILERKYPDYCPAEYIQMVVDSVTADPVELRKARYTRKKVAPPITLPAERKIIWIINNQHQIHHVNERGYVESPVRVNYIKKELERLGIFQTEKAVDYPEEFILRTHARSYVNYFKTVCRSLEPGKSVYPYVFPIRNQLRPPRELLVRAGYYCIDTFTPLNKNAYLAARGAVNCALTGADALISGSSLAYALVRPPGHHAEQNLFGGFCYFNNCAIAAEQLTRHGRVAILDIDYHHGNGQQQIFYHRKDVLTVSIHGDPSFAYPYFSGFKSETGAGEGVGYNLNLPLPEKLDGATYRQVLAQALKKIKSFNPQYLVVALGFDTASGDPTGTWSLRPGDFLENGRLLGEMRLPTLFVQEGGYKTRSLGAVAFSFFKGFWESYRS